jgi:DNA methylase
LIDALDSKLSSARCAGSTPDAVRDCSRRKGIVLDPFCGSGTALIAAERTGRCGFGIELDPLYCDVTLRRLRSVCGLQAVLEATGQSFEELALQPQEKLALTET